MTLTCNGCGAIAKVPIPSIEEMDRRGWDTPIPWPDGWRVLPTRTALTACSSTCEVMIRHVHRDRTAPTEKPS